MSLGLVGALGLYACSDGDSDASESNEPTSAESDDETDEEINDDTNDTDDDESGSQEVSSVYEAQAGDKVVEDYFGEFEFTDVIEVNESFTSGSIEGTLESVKFGTYTYEEDESTINIVTTIVSTENTSDEEMSFHTFIPMTTDTGQQIEPEMMLNGGDGSHLGTVKQEQYTSYNLGDENIEDISELNFHFDSAANSDYMSVDEDFVITVNID